MKMKFLVCTVATAIMFSSCVSKKKLEASQAQFQSLDNIYRKALADLKNCQDAVTGLQNDKSSLTTDRDSKVASLNKQIDDLNKQLDFLKQNSTQALKQLENMSVISGKQAESIKQSMENIGAKDMYIQDLQASIARKDSMNMALVMNLKGAIGNMADEDINIKVDKGVVYIDISDKLLFASGAWNVTAKANEVLGKVAMVLKNQPTIEFMVEGHTDNKEYKGTVFVDNWDLSVKRATSIVRILQTKYGLDPAKMTAAGRSEYVPVQTNETADGRAANRRTRIVILPQLDQFFKLLEPKK